MYKRDATAGFRLRGASGDRFISIWPRNTNEWVPVTCIHTGAKERIPCLLSSVGPFSFRNTVALFYMYQ